MTDTTATIDDIKSFSTDLASGGVHVTGVDATSDTYDGAVEVRLVLDLTDLDHPDISSLNDILRRVRSHWWDSGDDRPVRVSYLVSSAEGVDEPDDETDSDTHAPA